MKWCLGGVAPVVAGEGDKVSSGEVCTTCMPDVNGYGGILAMAYAILNVLL